MRVAVILVWRPKHFPSWQGRDKPPHEQVPAALAFDRSAAPYTGTHLASLLPRDWDIVLVHEMVRDVDLEMEVDAVVQPLEQAIECELRKFRFFT